MPSSSRGQVGWERLFWSVFERSCNAMSLVDEQRVFVEVNAAMCELLGVARDEVVGTPGDRFLAPQDRVEMAAEWREFWKSGDRVVERTVIRADGSRTRGEFAARTGEVSGRRFAVSVCIATQADEASAPPAQLGELTAREREVVSLIALGHTSSKIAEQLVISSETVSTHVRNAMAKTGARTRAQLVAMALGRGS
jgi:PAS domain S-box-containing protein